MAKKHYLFTDLIRIVAIPGVVLIHSSDYFINGGTYSHGLSWIILAFITNIFRSAVPLFFIISGFLILQKPILSIKKFYKKTFWRIGFPLIFWIIFDLIWNFLFNHQFYGISQTINLIFTNRIGVLYFLEALLGIYLLAPFLQKLNKNLTKNQQWLLLTLMIISSSGANLINQVGNPHSVRNVFNVSLSFICFFYAGHVLAGVKINKKLFQKLFVTFMLTTIFSFAGVYLNIFNLHKYWGDYQMPHIILMSFLAFLLFKYQEKFLNKTLNQIAKFWIGELTGLTYGIYLIHPYLIQVILKLKGFEISTVKNSGLLLFELKLFSIVYVISVFLVFSIKKTPYLKKIIGEK